MIEDFGEVDSPSDDYYAPQRIVEGINLDDFKTGKEIEFCSEYVEQNFEDLSLEDIGTECSEVKSWKTSEEERFIDAVLPHMTNIDEAGLVKKQLLKSGHGSVIGDTSSMITVHYNAYEESSPFPFDSTFLRRRPFRFQFGRQQTIEGLEIGVATMKKGEVSRFLISWLLAYGKRGCPPRIPPEADILFDVTVVNVTSDSSGLSDGLSEEEATVSFARKLKEAKQFNVVGNDLFKSKNYRNAITNYEKAINLIQYLKIPDEQSATHLSSMKLKLHANLANSFNKIGKHKLACIECKAALDIDRSHIKSMFQFGKALTELCNFKDARHWLLKAQRMQPDNHDINEQLKKLDKKQEQSKINEKMFCTKFLGREKKNKCDEEMVRKDLEVFTNSMREVLEEFLRDETKQELDLKLTLDRNEVDVCDNLAEQLNMQLSLSTDRVLFKKFS